MVHQTMLRHSLIFGALFAIVAVRVNTQAASWHKLTPHLNVLRVHQRYKVLHYGVHAVLMELPLATVAEKVEFQRFALNQFLIRYVTDVDGCKIRL